MPFRYAHYFLLMLIPAAALGFISYLGELGQAGIAKHLHAIAATLWILLLAGQSATIHNGMNRLHRRLGCASLFLFPAYLCGFFLVYRSEARRIIDGDPYATVFGPGIGAMTLIAIAATAYMYYAGLRNRRNVHLHSRWMLVTVFLFAESVFGRIFNNLVPGLLVLGIEDVRKIYDAFHLSQLLAITLAFVLFIRDRKHGTPFIFVVAVLILQSVALELFDGIDAWRQLFVQSGSWPQAAFAVTGLVFGSACALYGWRQGRPQRGLGTVASAA